MSVDRSRRIVSLGAAARNGRILFLGALVFSVFVNILMLTGPLFMLQVYDRVLGSRSEETLVSLFLLVALLYFLMALLDFARGRVLARIGLRIHKAIEEDLVRVVVKVARQSPLHRHALRDLENVSGFMGSPALLAMLDLPFTPIFFLAIFIFHPVLGWLGLAGGAALILLTLTNQLITSRKTRRANIESEVAHSFASEAIKASDIVRSQGMMENVVRRWKQQQQKAMHASLFAADWTGSFAALTKSTRLFLQSAMLGVGAYLVLQNDITAGGMIAGTILLGRALAPIEQLLGQWTLVQRFRNSWSSINKILAATPVDPPKTKLPVPASILDVRGISVIPSGSKQATLKNITFRIQPGTALGIIGQSGSGKSTLAKALVGLWPPAAGEIRLGGATLDQYDAEILGQRIGYLPQSVNLLSGTVAENIARMSSNPDAEAIVAAAKKANAHEIIMQLPKGYDTVIGDDFAQLSGGQMQRIALARAFYGDPVLLVLDEPNSALDAAGSDALNEAIRAFKATERSVVVMTHRPAAISECETLLILVNGVVAEYGPRDEVLARRTKNAGSILSVIEKAKS